MADDPGASPASSLPARFGRRAVGWTVGWLMAAALYLLLIDITDLPELIVGAGAAVLGATAYELARERDVTGLATRAGWLKNAYRPLLRVPGDVAMLTGAAVAQLWRREAAVGCLRAVPFACGEEPGLRGGRAAMAESLGSFAPNTIIVGVDADRELLLGHQLRRSGGADAIDILRLG